MVTIKINDINKGDYLHFFYAGNGEWITCWVAEVHANYIKVYNQDKNAYRCYRKSQISDIELRQ